MDAATRLFQNIVRAGEPGLVQMCSDRHEENHLLDFKEASKQAPPLEGDDKRNLAKGLGGFANTGGGVIVWGVACKSVEGIDAAFCTKPIAKVRQFKSLLESVTPDLLEPCPDGILHEAIYSADSNECGYVVSLVPFYDGYPVRSVLKDRGADFFMRVGNRFERMPYSFLADRFGRRPQPKLRLRARIKRDTRSFDTQLYFRVVNEGRGTATSVAVVYDANIPMPQYSGWGRASGFGTSEDNFEDANICWTAPDSMPIYPDCSRVCAFYMQSMSAVAFSAIESSGNVSYKVFCDGSAHQGELKWVWRKNDTFEQIMELVEVK